MSNVERRDAVVCVDRRSWSTQFARSHSGNDEQELLVSLPVQLWSESIRGIAREKREQQLWRWSFRCGNVHAWIRCSSCTRNSIEQYKPIENLQGNLLHVTHRFVRVSRDKESMWVAWRSRHLLCLYQSMSTWSHSISKNTCVRQRTTSPNGSNSSVEKIEIDVQDAIQSTKLLMDKNLSMP